MLVIIIITKIIRIIRKWKSWVLNFEKEIHMHDLCAGQKLGRQNNRPIFSQRDTPLFLGFPFVALKEKEISASGRLRFWTRGPGGAKAQLRHLRLQTGYH